MVSWVYHVRVTLSLKSTLFFAISTFYINLNIPIHFNYYLPMNLLASIHWDCFWLIEGPYPAVSEHVTKEESHTAEPKGTDIMGEGFATPDSASPVTDIHWVRYNLLKVEHRSAVKLFMLSFKMTMFFVIFMIWHQSLVRCIRIKLNNTLKLTLYSLSWNNFLSSW